MKQFISGISLVIKDLSAFKENYKTDWLEVGLEPHKLLYSTLFTLLNSIGTSLVISLFLFNHTNKSLGTIEVLFSCFLTGILHSLFSSQPLLIQGVSAPMVLLCININNIASFYDFNFFTLLSLSQIWAGVFFLFSGLLLRKSYMDSFFSSFSYEIYDLFIIMLYFFIGIEGIISRLIENESEVSMNFNLSIKLVDILLFFSMIVLCYILANLRKFYPDVNLKLNDFLVNYKIIIVLIFLVFLSYILNLVLYSVDNSEKEYLHFLYLSLKFTPSNNRNSFFINLFTRDCSTSLFFWSIFLGLLIFLLQLFNFYYVFKICNDKKYKLKKRGSSVNYELILLGMGIFFTASLGLPPSSPLIFESILHIESLTVKKSRVSSSSNSSPSNFDNFITYSSFHDILSDDEVIKIEDDVENQIETSTPTSSQPPLLFSSLVIIKTREQRWTNQLDQLYLERIKKVKKHGILEESNENNDELDVNFSENDISSCDDDNSSCEDDENEEILSEIEEQNLSQSFTYNSIHEENEIKHVMNILKEGNLIEKKKKKKLKNQANDSYISDNYSIDERISKNVENEVMINSHSSNSYSNVFNKVNLLKAFKSSSPLPPKHPNSVSTPTSSSPTPSSSFSRQNFGSSLSNDLNDIINTRPRKSSLKSTSGEKVYKKVTFHSDSFSN